MNPPLRVLSLHLYREDFLLSTPASRAWLFWAMIFIVSPLSLYFNRLSSLLVVFGLIFASYFFLVIPKLSLRRVPTSIDLASAVFLGYMSANCTVALMTGHLASNAIADLVSPLEIYLCFQISKRLDFPKEIAFRWLKWILVFTLLRAVWQIFTTLGQIHLMAPIYDVSAVAPLGTIGRFTFERPIDPVSGMMFALALMLYIFGIERRWSLLTTIFTAIVLVLGLTRSEWIAGVVAVCIGMFYAGKLRTAFKIFVVIALIFAAGFVVFPSLYESLRDRLITHTVEQVTTTEEAAVGALRILEFSTALEKFQTAPIFGHGLGSWFGTNVNYNGRETFVQLHNSYLNLLTNAGLVGVGLLFIVMLKLRRLLLTCIRQGNRLSRLLLCVGVGALAWYGIFMAFEPIYSAYHLPALIGTIWGLGLTSVQNPDSTSRALATHIPRSLR